MKTKTVVELCEKDVVDALIAKAREACQPKGGGVNVEFISVNKSIECPTVRVVFEWGSAK